MAAEQLKLEMPGRCECTVEGTQDLDPLSEVWTKFWTALWLLHDKVPLARFDFAPLGTDYEYKFTAADGRLFPQVIRPDAALPDDPPMSFGPSGFFRQAAEFAYHREVRDRVVEMMVHHGVTKIKVEWP